MITRPLGGADGAGEIGGGGWGWGRAGGGRGGGDVDGGRAAHERRHGSGQHGGGRRDQPHLPERGHRVSRRGGRPDEGDQDSHAARARDLAAHVQQGGPGAGRGGGQCGGARAHQRGQG